jgi:SAM-dependent methyltransferase
MTNPPQPDPTTRFSSRAADYARHRPGYPAEAVALVVRACGLSADSAVADVGSGTGIFTAQLLDAGCRVFAVEPNGPMRGIAEAALGGNPNFASLAGRAEATGLGAASVNAVTAAQAFHWFDWPAFRAECMRILKPGGRVVLLWNDRADGASAYMEAFADFIRRHATDYSRVDHRLVGPDEIRRFYGTAPARHVFENHQELDLEGGVGRLGSVSYMPARGEPGYEAMVADYTELFHAHSTDGRVRLLYNTEVHIGHLAPDSA